MADVVRRIEVVGKATGMETLKAKLQEVAAAQNNVAVSADKMSRTQGSAEARVTRLQASLDPAFRSSQQMAAAQRNLDMALAQGVISQQRHAQLLDLATAKYQLNTGAAVANASAVKMVAAANQNAGYQSRMLMFQLNDIAQTLALGMSPLQVAMQQGPQIAQIYQGQGGVAAAFRQTGQMALGAGRAVLGFAAANPIASAAALALSGGLYNVTQELQAAGHEAIGFGDVMVAAMQVAATGISQFFKPAVDFIGPYVGAAWDWISDKTKWLANAVINAFRAAGADIQFVWNQIPNAVGAAAIGTANNVIGAINQMVQGAVSGIDWFIEKVNSLPGVDLGTLGSVGSIPEIANPFADALAKANAEHKKLIDSIKASDPIGDFFDAVKVQAVANAMKEVESTSSKAGKAVKTAADAGKDAWAGLRDVTHQTGEALADAMKFARDVTGGFISDLRDGLKNGEGFFNALKNAATNALEKIADTLLNKVLDAMFQVSNAGNQSGGLLGGLLSIFGIGSSPVNFAGKVGLFANGAAFNGGHVVNQPTIFPMARGAGLMGEAGPEAVMPLKRGPGGSLGVAVHGGGVSASQQAISVDVRAYVDDNGNWKAEVEKISGQQIKGYDKAVAPKRGVQSVAKARRYGVNV